MPVMKMVVNNQVHCDFTGAHNSRLSAEAMRPDAKAIM
jgi:hypothetical protein